MDEGKEERPKREIVTTELVAGADFFHHLPCAAQKTTIGELERVRVKPRSHQPRTKHKRSKRKAVVMSCLTSY